MRFIRVGKVFGIVHNTPERGTHGGLIVRHEMRKGGYVSGDIFARDGHSFGGSYSWEKRGDRVTHPKTFVDHSVQIRKHRDGVTSDFLGSLKARTNLRAELVPCTSSCKKVI